MKGKEIVLITTEKLLKNEFKIYGSFEDPLFQAKDVADWLDIKNVSQMLDGVDADEKGIFNVYTLGGNQDVWFLTEMGLYEVIFQSRKEKAKQFKKQVKDLLKKLRIENANQIALKMHKQTEQYKQARLESTILQKEQMDKLGKGKPKINYIKANSIANKAVSLQFGLKKSLKKDDMSSDQIKARDKHLQVATTLMQVKEFGIEVPSVSKIVYDNIKNLPI